MIKDTYLFEMSIVQIYIIVNKKQLLRWNKVGIGGKIKSVLGLKYETGSER